MGEIRRPRPALLILAVFSQHNDALDWAQERASRSWGPVILASPRFSFSQTDFYQRSMGSSLTKCLLAFERPIDSGRLIELKHQTNRWEEDFRRSHGYLEPRPLNLDPGYLTEAKLVLATTKDRDHRIYLGQGIFAEVTLYFHSGQWKARPWTYPDYKTAEYHEFFDECRGRLRQWLKTCHGG